MIGKDEYLPNFTEKIAEIEAMDIGDLNSWLASYEDNEFREKLREAFGPTFNQLRFELQKYRDLLADAYRTMERIIYGGPFDETTHEDFGTMWEFSSFHQSRKPSDGQTPLDFDFFKMPGVYGLIKLLFAFRYGYDNPWMDFDNKEGTSTGPFQVLQDLMNEGSEWDPEQGRNVPKVVMHLKREMEKAQEPMTPDSDIGRRIIEMIRTPDFESRVSEEAVSSVNNAVASRVDQRILELLGGNSDYEVVINDERKKVTITKEERGKQLTKLLDQMLLEVKRREMIKEMDGQRFRKARETAKVA